jgi:AcrR family transcriptional regulator
VTLVTIRDDAPRGKRGPYRKGLERRQGIVEAATQVFAEVGYNGGSLRGISDRVGVSSASLVQYFGSKEGLLMAVLKEWGHQAHAIGARDLHGLAWISSIREAMRYNVHHRGLVDLLLTLTTEASHPAHPARPFIRERYIAIIAEFGRHLREAVDAGEVLPLTDAEIEREARLFFAVMDGIELQWLIDPSVDVVGVFDHHVDQTIRSWQRQSATP